MIGFMLNSRRMAPKPTTPARPPEDARQHARAAARAIDPGPMSKIILKELHWIVEEKHKVDACQQHGLPLSQVRLTVEEAVLKYGRANIGIERPKGFRRQRARKHCFMNAADAALRGRGQYVEGYALNRPDHLRMIFHQPRRVSQPDGFGPQFEACAAGKDFAFGSLDRYERVMRWGSSAPGWRSCLF